MVESPLVRVSTQDYPVSRIDKIRVRVCEQFSEMIAVFDLQLRNRSIPGWHRRVEVTSVPGCTGTSGVSPPETIQFRTHLPHDFVDGETRQSRRLSMRIRFFLPYPQYAISLANTCV